MRRIVPCLLALFFFCAPAHAVVLSRLFDFEGDTPAEADQVNAELDNIISALNGNLDGLYNLSQNSVATGNIATAAVTQVKLGPKGQQISTSSGTSQRSLSTFGLVPNMTGNLTVISRPVWVGLQSDGAAAGRVYYRHSGTGATDNSATITFQRDVATVNQAAIGVRNITTPTNNTLEQLPCSAFWFVDVPSPGPHNYTAGFQIAPGDSGLITVENCKLVMFEL